MFSTLARAFSETLKGCGREDVMKKRELCKQQKKKDCKLAERIDVWRSRKIFRDHERWRKSWDTVYRGVLKSSFVEMETWRKHE